jgi:hypothetical protein
MTDWVSCVSTDSSALMLVSASSSMDRRSTEDRVAGIGRFDITGEKSDPAYVLGNI